MGHKIIGWDLDGFALHDVFQSLVHQVIIERICRDGTKGKTIQVSWGRRELPLPWGQPPTADASGTHDPKEHLGWELPLQFTFTEPSAVLQTTGTDLSLLTTAVSLPRLLPHPEVWTQGFPDQLLLGGRWVRHLFLFLENNHQMTSSHVSQERYENESQP